MGWEGAGQGGGMGGGCKHQYHFSIMRRVDFLHFADLFLVSVSLALSYRSVLVGWFIAFPGAVESCENACTVETFMSMLVLKSRSVMAYPAQASVRIIVGFVWVCNPLFCGGCFCSCFLAFFSFL